VRSTNRESFSWHKVGSASESRSGKVLTLRFHDGTTFIISKRQLQGVLAGKIREAAILEPPAQYRFRKWSARVKRLDERKERRAHARKEIYPKHIEGVAVLKDEDMRLFDRLRKEESKKRKLLSER
jgi:hypothetical protein